MTVITISREYGSGGDEVATRVCEILGYRYFDKTLIAGLATEVDEASERLLDFSEEQHEPRLPLLRLFTGPRIVGEVRREHPGADGTPVVEIERMDEDQSASSVQSTILAAYRLGNVVILGRAGQVILKDLPGVLHVRIEAPLGRRIEQVKQTHALSYGAAAELVSRRDRAAADYLRRFYNVDWADRAYYHLVINAARWTREGTAQLLIHALRHLPGLQG